MQKAEVTLAVEHLQKHWKKIRGSSIPPLELTADVTNVVMVLGFTKKRVEALADAYAKQESQG